MIAPGRDRGDRRPPVEPRASGPSGRTTMPVITSPMTRMRGGALLKIKIVSFPALADTR